MTDQNVKIGEKIRELRTKLGMSIEDVSRQAEISASTIVEIEGHNVSPPLGQIVSLAKTFQVPVGDILGGSADSSFCIVRCNSREKVSRFSSDVKPDGYSYDSLGHQKKNRQMEPFHVTLTPAEAPLAEPNLHAGEEILFVLTGQVEVTLSGHTDILNPGDSIYFDSNLPHVVSCHGDKPATIFAVIYAEKEMLIF
jgi:transcriptional regulator with XRE-family HTH domain